MIGTRYLLKEGLEFELLFLHFVRRIGEDVKTDGYLLFLTGHCDFILN